MARLRYNGLSTTLGASLSSGATSVTFAAALTHSGGTAVPTLAGGNYIPLSILDANGKLAEIVHLTAYTAAATTGTIVRGREGTTGVAHASGAVVAHAPSVLDIAGQPWEEFITERAPVHRWKFNEASGTNVDDSVGSLDLTLSGTYARAAAGPFGASGATTFTNATADSSGLGSVPTLTADRTVAFLFKAATSTAGTRMTPFGYGTPVAGQLFYFGINDYGSGPEANTFSGNVGGAGEFLNVKPFALSDGLWHLGVLALRAAGKARLVAVDTLIGSGVFTAASTPASGNFRVGKTIDNAFTFDGDISDVSVYNYAWTPEMVVDARRSMLLSMG